MRPELLIFLRSTSRETGVPMARIIEDALDRYVPKLRQRFEDHHAEHEE
jgi:hypothetical protein